MFVVIVTNNTEETTIPCTCTLFSSKVYANMKAMDLCLERAGDVSEQDIRYAIDDAGTWTNGRFQVVVMECD